MGMNVVCHEQRGEVHAIARQRLDMMVDHVPHVLSRCQAIMLDCGGCRNAETKKSPKIFHSGKVSE